MGFLNPYILGAALAVALAAGGWHLHIVHGLEAEVSAAQHETAVCMTDLVVERGNVASLEKAQGIVTADRDALRAKVEAQNASISHLRDVAALATAQADERVQAALRASAAERQAVANLPGAGPKVMNDWLRKEFTP
jgi:hypothetical protein